MTSTRFELFSYWLLSTNAGKAMLWCLERLAFIVGVLVTMAGVYALDQSLFPVIRDWKMLSIERQANTYVVSGTLYKTRPCELIATSIMAVPKAPLLPRQLIYQLKPSEILGGNVPTGHTTWGPLVMQIPKALLEHRSEISFLEVVGHHRCHGLWNQETLYGAIRMEELP